MAKDVLFLGDPRLRIVCPPVNIVTDATFNDDARVLRETLEKFRAAHGFGRGMAAPQIGVAKRFICVSLGGETRTIINPRITWRSDETFTLWDDCMCFPHLLVKVRRAASITVCYQDEVGLERSIAKLNRAESELLQHEIDHLDGILAVDRAENSHGIIYREAFKAHKTHFTRQVDTAIEPGGHP